MHFFKYAFVFVVCLALLEPADGGWLRKTIKKIGRGAKKIVKKVVEPIKKLGCKILFGVACPAAVGTAGAALGTITSGVGSAIVAAGVVMGTNACHVRKEKCKRSVSTVEIMYPFSDEFTDYDLDDDKYITQEEFFYAVLSSVTLADPDELWEPFLFADADGDGKLDTDEFIAAPFLFAHPNYVNDVQDSYGMSPAA